MKLIQTYRESDNLVDWLQRFVGTVAEIQNYQDVTFENSWSNISGEAAVQYYIDPYKRVHIKGAADSGTNGTTAFTLPKGYRPTEKLRFVVTKLTGAIGVVTIDTDGTVDSTVGNTNGVELNLSFRG
jgi:hypothetical protein